MHLHYHSTATHPPASGAFRVLQGADRKWDGAGELLVTTVRYKIGLVAVQADFSSFLPKLKVKLHDFPRVV